MRRNVKRGMAPFTAGLLAIIVAVVATYLAFTKENPFASPYEVSAVFPTANNLKPGSLVRIAGVNVGEVTEVEHTGGGAESARVTMEISDEGRPIHKDATMKIRPRILFEGNFFVDVHPGSPSAPELDDGETVPINQTSSPVQLDQVLKALQKDSRESLKTVLDGLSSGLKGEGAAGYRRSIRWWEPAYRDSAIVSDAQLGLMQHDLSGYIRGAGRVAEALDRNDEQLKSLITDLHTTAGALAAADTELADAIGELPRTLQAGLPALEALNRALPPVRRFARDFLPGVRSSGPAIDAQIPFVRQLRRLVQASELRGLADDLAAAVPDLARLNRDSIPFAKETRAGASCQNEVILPWAEDTVPDERFPAKGPVYQEQSKSLVGLAGESRTFDANGQWFRVSLNPALYATHTFGNRFYLTGRPITSVNPPPPAQRPPLRPDVPCETQERPNLETVPAKPKEPSFLIQPADKAKAAAREKQAREVAIDWLRDQLKAEGKTGAKVVDDLISRGELPKLAGTAALKKQAGSTTGRDGDGRSKARKEAAKR